MGGGRPLHHEAFPAGARREEGEKMNEHLRRDELHDACAKLARIVLSGTAGVSQDIVETVAARFQGEAESFAAFVWQLGRDPNLLIRAVYYLADAHAVPTMGGDVAWFRHMLACVVELAVPSISLSGEAADFLEDVRAGIHQSLEDRAE